MSDAPIVDFKAVSKTFVLPGAWPWSPKREVHAVRDVSFQVAPGEVLALVGQSGSGKTTVSRCVLGLESITSGEIVLEGQRWDTLSERERRTKRVKYQYVPQDALSALDPQQTSLEHVVESLTVLGGVSREEAHKRGAEMLESLGLGHRLNALPREMSGGEQRRVTLARVFVLQPSLVVADEPTSGLDPDRQESVLEDLIQNLPKGAGCILVTHDMAQARAWCHRALVMLEGRVVEELRFPDGQPTHPYSRMLFDPWGEHDLAQSTAI
ncbi:MAG: ABC transporter ATP-binding protein [Deltaproteobacteria bacterium]|nr:MAG: ABC transporter ATP-binding protein [Deltaproteobacteria bacterium]